MPNLAGADSVAIMYYNTPNDPRFFRYVKEYDVQKMRQVISDANGKVIAQRPDCATQGKIYFYEEKGAIDVLYFSNKDECMTFSFIITGEKYFVKMSAGSSELLNKFKLLARDPSETN